ncbi:two component transcriptional regulator, LuxR family [Chryseolinea serpens]|uniref:Two component transcriptional regulator, LuxR family n=1 Tax=Chryseolinea serpens TaxID=947013 RepID=A0A1M5JX50_9BACT|nr:response regulator transcription factor [Chryseolinea serpens]SHG44955.1 two component transcriptional regulator, LuxR family [Chryseolinea serpens]
MIRLVIAEDHNALIDGVKLLLEHEQDIQFVGYANNGRELCDLVKLKKPDVVITDIRMPIMDGITATRLILKTDPNTKVIAFTMFDQDDAVQQMLEAGARGYILKNSNLSELLFAIRTVYMNNYYYDAGITVSGGEKKEKALLTKRQIEILKLIALGKTNQEIGDQLFIGKTTVETHRKNMIRILNLKGAGELLRYALESKYKF